MCTRQIPILDLGSIFDRIRISKALKVICLLIKLGENYFPAIDSGSIVISVVAVQIIALVLFCFETLCS